MSDHKGSIIAGAIILQLLACGSVFLRFLARRKARKALLKADWIMSVALVVDIAFTTMDVWGKTHFSQHL
jgi:uncharacterized membrane protein